MNRRLAAATAVLAVAALSACSAAGAASREAPSEPAAPVAPAPDVVGEVAAPVPVVDGVVPVAKADLDSIAPLPQPSRLRVERLGIDMRVVDVGIEDDGSMELHKSAGVAGWFRLGGNPAGGFRADQNVVIAAHVDDAVMGRGPFAELRDARRGDRVEVRLGDGSTAVYVVDRVEQTSKREVDFSQVFGEPDGALVLVTCGGRWDRDVRHYEDNVLVWAYPEDAR